VTSLDLCGIELDYKSGAELALAFAAIPVSVTSLNLNRNGLGSSFGTALAQAFAVIPASVTSLDLCWNKLGTKSGAELAQAFAAIPASVTSLDLCWNKLGNKSGAELALAFAAIPASVTSLDLSGNGLPMDNIWQLLPETISTIVIDNKHHYNRNIILTHIKNALSSDLSKSLIPLEAIKLPYDVTESNLNLIIDDLESHASCEALLACGALLEGRIENSINEDKSPEYVEKRIHDVISFYLKAYDKAKNESILKSNIEGILWEIRTCSDFDSVKNRLSNLPLRPYGVSEETQKYCAFNPVLPFSFFAPCKPPFTSALNIDSCNSESVLSYNSSQ